MIIHSVGMGGFLYMNSHTISKTKVETSKTDKGTSTESTSATSKKENTTSLSDSVVKNSGNGTGRRGERCIHRK